MSTKPDDQTKATVDALRAINAHVPRLANDLTAGTLPVVKQHEFAGLLIELGELLHQHADDRTSGVIPDEVHRPNDNPSSPRHAFRKPSAAPPDDFDPFLS